MLYATFGTELLLSEGRDQVWAKVRHFHSLTNKNKMKSFLFPWVALLFLTFVGCGGPKLQGFNGAVTYDGKPLEGGIIFFTPDARKGNLMGASNVASIKDGRYELPVSQGISGGWYLIRVEVTEAVVGVEGEHEKFLIPPYEFSNEFKPDDKVFDIDIPKQK